MKKKQPATKNKNGPAKRLPTGEYKAIKGGVSGATTVSATAIESSSFTEKAAIKTGVGRIMKE